MCQLKVDLKSYFNRLAKAYFLSRWRPSVWALAIFAVLFANEFKGHIRFVSFVFLLAFTASLLGILVSGIVQLVKGRKVSGLFNLFAFFAVGLAAFLGMGFLAVVELFDDQPDNFGKNIVIPANMQVSDPVENFDESGGPVVDELTTNIAAAFLANIPSNTTSVSTDLSLLNEFATDNRDKLIQYLSASPRWFVTEEDGISYAYRRLVVGGRWQNALNGFYSSFEVSSEEPRFQTRIVIGFDGPVFLQPFRKVLTTAKVGAGEVPVRAVDDKEFHQGKESYFVLQGSRASIEIFEQSGRDARPITQLALADIKQELEAALALTNATMQPMLGKDEPPVQLANGMQGGIYQVRVFANPGEPGRVYLKVFEATQNTRLSATRIEERSISRIGWSTNAADKFRYQSEVTVYEGDWGTFYPARFELWFIPDSSGPQRKLADRIFRIEGWQR